EALHPLGEPVDQLVVDVERKELLQELLVRMAHLLHVRATLLLGETPHGAVLHLREPPMEHADPIDRLERTGPLALRRELGIPVAEVDLGEVLDPHLALLQLGAEADQLFEYGARSEERGANLALARLDALRDLDFTFAVEQRHAPH